MGVVADGQLFSIRIRGCFGPLVVLLVEGGNWILNGGGDKGVVLGLKWKNGGGGVVRNGSWWF